MSVEGLAARRAAYQAVRKVHERGAWASPAVGRAIEGLAARDRSFTANLAFETLRWEGTLDWALARVVRRDEVDPRVRDVLRLGAWQIGFGATPARAAVDTSVTLVREVAGDRASGFVNGVLRSLAREWERLPWPDPSTDAGMALALGYPEWVVVEARARFGDEAVRVLEAGNRPPGLTLRTGARDALLSELRAAGHEAQPGVLASEAVRVPGAHPDDLPGVAQGRATVQDEASMIVTEALLAAAGHAPRVLDVCAGPGGKATHLAARGADVTAADVHPARARLVADHADRLGLDLRVCAADGTAPPWRPGSFDAVLLDVPCSGLGVVRRRPELRWRRAATDVATLAKLQRALVDAAVPLLDRAGILCYSACTWTVAETSAVVGSAARRHGLGIVDVPAGLSRRGRTEGPGLLLRPDDHDTDGMYIACLRQTST